MNYAAGSKSFKESCILSSKSEFNFISSVLLKIKTLTFNSLSDDSFLLHSYVYTALRSAFKGMHAKNEQSNINKLLCEVRIKL